MCVGRRSGATSRGSQSSVDVKVDNSNIGGRGSVSVENNVYGAGDGVDSTNMTDLPNFHNDDNDTDTATTLLANSISSNNNSSNKDTNANIPITRASVTAIECTYSPYEYDCSGLDSLLSQLPFKLTHTGTKDVETMPDIGIVCILCCAARM